MHYYGHEHIRDCNALRTTPEELFGARRDGRRVPSLRCLVAPHVHLNSVMIVVARQEVLCLVVLLLRRHVK